LRRDPTSLEDTAEPSADAEDPPPTAPTASARRKWLIIGCGGLIILLIFACMVALVAYSWLLYSGLDAVATQAAVGLPTALVAITP
jgi:hypothetical protein